MDYGLESYFPPPPPPLGADSSDLKSRLYSRRLRSQLMQHGMWSIADPPGPVAPPGPQYNGARKPRQDILAFCGPGDYCIVDNGTTVRLGRELDSDDVWPGGIPIGDLITVLETCEWEGVVNGRVERHVRGRIEFQDFGDENTGPTMIRGWVSIRDMRTGEWISIPKIPLDAPLLNELSQQADRGKPATLRKQPMSHRQQRREQQRQQILDQSYMAHLQRHKQLTQRLGQGIGAQWVEAPEFDGQNDNMDSDAQGVTWGGV